MKLFKFRIIILLIPVCLTSHPAEGSFPLRSENDNVKDTSFVSRFEADNNRCFNCHGQEKYEYTNETLGRQVRALMCSDLIVDKSGFYASNHKSFSCTDCHSDQYMKFPHSGELRMEQKYNCLDCHGGDEKFARYHFEEIDSEYRQSTHFKLERDGFSCWKCHNPHSYKITVRNSANIKNAILYDNNICLGCHANFDRFLLLTDRKEISILKTHNWLPNQAAHFQNVRCIECHTTTNENILVSHLIKPKEKAVRLCNECHAQNSLLMSSLYKFRSKEQRRNSGFVNGVILNESYVIGANRNAYLNQLSLVIFFGILVIIIIHIVFRIIKSKKVLKGGQDVSIS
jgi:Cytochrome c3